MTNRIPTFTSKGQGRSEKFGPAPLSTIAFRPRIFAQVAFCAPRWYLWSFSHFTRVESHPGALFCGFTLTVRPSRRSLYSLYPARRELRKER